MKLILLPSIFALAFAFPSCVSTPSKSDQAKPVATAPAVKPYPLKTCIVTDEDLDSMDGAVTRVHNGQEVKFCCKSCVKKFEADPAKYLAKLP
jgi:YHS domain-containing protein